MLAPRGRLIACIALYGFLGIIVNFPEGYSNSFPNTSYLSFQQMFNTSYIKRGLQNGLSSSTFTWLWSATLNIWFIGYLVGTFATPFVTENYGRKRALIVSNGIALFGSTLGVISAVFGVPELFIVSRFVISIGTGISFASLMLFMQETSPTEYRGMTSFMSETAFVGTVVLGVGFGMAGVFGKNLPALTGIAILPAIASILIMIPLHETPKFLLINKSNRQAALESLIFYQGEDEQTEAVLDEILLEAEGVDDKQEPLWHSVLTVLKEPVLRTSFFIGCLATQIIVPVWPLLYLSTDILSVHFSEASAQYISLGFIGANFVAGICGMGIIERIGRRPLLLTMGAINTFSICLYVLFDRLSFMNASFRWGTVAALILFGVTYGVALGPIAFFITSELVVQRYRSVVQSMVFAVNTVTNFAVSFITLPLFEQFTSLSFLPLFVLPCVLSLLYLYFNMPETLGREVHEIAEELMEKCGKQRKRRGGRVAAIFPNINSLEGGLKKGYGSGASQNESIYFDSIRGSLHIELNNNSATSLDEISDKSEDSLANKIY